MAADFSQTQVFWCRRGVTYMAGSQPLLIGETTIPALRPGL